MALTDKEIESTAELLKKLEPGFLPYPIFLQVARISALPIVELVPLRVSPEGAVEVLLIERPADDPQFPGMLHTPGTVVRATDVHQGGQDDWQAFERLRHEELMDTVVGPPQYIGSMFHNSKRGTEQAQLYWVEVTGDPKVGAFYDAAALPGSLIDSQVEFIGQAVHNFKTSKGI